DRGPRRPTTTGRSRCRTTTPDRPAARARPARAARYPRPAPRAGTRQAGALSRRTPGELARVRGVAVRADRQVGGSGRRGREVVEVEPLVAALHGNRAADVDHAVRPGPELDGELPAQVTGQRPVHGARYDTSIGRDRTRRAGVRAEARPHRGRDGGLDR